MRIAICDDCPEDALHLKALLGGQKVRTYSDMDSLLVDVEYKNVHYDLYLLDIFMDTPEGDSMKNTKERTAGNIPAERPEICAENSPQDVTQMPADGSLTCGIDLAKRLRALDSEAAICFVSTSDAFYREAYDLYAVQYLLKPVREEDIRMLLDRVARNLARDKEQSLSFKRGGQTGSIPYSKILYISSREHTISICCKDGTVQDCKGKLNEIALQVCGDVFLRCHQSFLVNMYQIDNLSGYELMVAGHRIPISRRYYTEVKKRYQEVLFEEVD